MGARGAGPLGYALRMIRYRSMSAVASLGLVLSITPACGGSVVFVEDGGDGGAGGAGGSGTTTSSSKSTTVGMATKGSSAISTVQSTSGQVVSVGTTGSSGCDTGVPATIESFECQSCVDCSINGACFGAYSACENGPECFPFVDCISNCGNPGCEQQCQEAFPTGAQQYLDLWICVVCEDCANNCDAQSNCGMF